MAEVAVPAGKTDDLDLILAAPRLLNACKMMTQAMARYRDFGEPYDHDEGMLNAILEIKKGARLFQGTKHRKGGTIPEGEGGMK